MSGQEKTEVKLDINWPWVLWCIYLHILGVYGIYMIFTSSMWLTIIYAAMIITLGSLGLTIGAHRLWAHQSYETSGYIKFILMLGQTLAGVGPIYDWVLAHRMHHKFHGTDKDPFNHNRGFLYSHVVSNFYKKSPEYEKHTKAIDMRDMESDGIIWFQKLFYGPLFLIVGILLPINTPAEYWGESISTSFFVIGFLRLGILLNISWLINSATHIWSLKPHEKFPPDDNLIFLINRSHWLAYHYLLPWDWKSGEFGSYDNGLSTSVIKILDSFGLIRDMKTASNQSIRDALFTLASSKKSIDDVLGNVKEIADYDAAKVNLKYYH